jgi:hypothetical protein
MDAVILAMQQLSAEEREQLLTRLLAPGLAQVLNSQYETFI